MSSNDIGWLVGLLAGLLVMIWFGIISIGTVLKRMADAAERTPAERKAYAANKRMAEEAKRNSTADKAKRRADEYKRRASE